MIVAYKTVDIMAPEKANKLGILAECPVLVSPFVQSGKDCLECGAQWAPLIYQVGMTTRTLHVSGRCPGVFHAHYLDCIPGRATSHWYIVLIGKTDSPSKALGRCTGGMALPEDMYCSCGTMFHAERAVVTTREGGTVYYRTDNGEYDLILAGDMLHPGFGAQNGWRLLLRDGGVSFTRI